MKRVYIGTLAALALIASLVVVGGAATKSYQFTGTVKAVDGAQVTVEKSAKETWVFDTDKDTKGGTPKVGDKVTVYYKMVATEFEAKAAAGAAAKPAKKK